MKEGLNLKLINILYIVTVPNLLCILYDYYNDKFWSKNIYKYISKTPFWKNVTYRLNKQFNFADLCIFLFFLEYFFLLKLITICKIEYRDIQSELRKKMMIMLKKKIKREILIYSIIIYLYFQYSIMSHMIYFVMLVQGLF